MVASLAKLGFDPMFWQFLAEPKCGDVLRALASEARRLGSELDAFDVAEAVYWIASDYGGSEFCPLRRASNVSEFYPGPLAMGPNGSAAIDLYSAMATVLEGCA